jgi:hypothetical protein
MSLVPAIHGGLEGLVLGKVIASLPSVRPLVLANDVNRVAVKGILPTENDAVVLVLRVEKFAGSA